MDIELFDQPLPHGTTLSCRAAGAADARQRVLLLHGFPEGAFVWDDVMRALAPRARCVAPNLRGYGHSSAPREVEAYRAKYLVADLAALIDSVGAPIDVLVAHDWGGAVAWNLAALQPRLVRQLVIINSPHPAAFLRELRQSLAQQAASAYMNKLVRPDAAARLAADDFARLWALFDPFGRATWLTPALQANYRALWAQGLDGALNWYRASPLRPPTDDPATRQALAALQLPPALVDVAVPTTVLWGEADIALLPGLLDGLEQWVPKLRVQRVSDATHWIVHERPALVVAVIQAALDAAALAA